jgi:hypothetical protein
VLYIPVEDLVEGVEDVVEDVESVEVFMAAQCCPARANVQFEPTPRIQPPLAEVWRFF